MTYTEIVRMASSITKNSKTCKDLAHDYYLNMREKDIDILNIEKVEAVRSPGSFIYRGLYNTYMGDYRRIRTYKQDFERIAVSFLDITELEIGKNQSSPLDLAISGDLLTQSKKAIIKGVSNQKKYNSRYTDKSNYLRAFDMYVEGYDPLTISKELNISQQSLNFIRLKIKEWIKPILKG